MFNMTRYINGNEVFDKDLSKYEIDNELILLTIKNVNKRLWENFPHGTFEKNTVEKKN